MKISIVVRLDFRIIIAGDGNVRETKLLMETLLVTIGFIHLVTWRAKKLFWNMTDEIRD